MMNAERLPELKLAYQRWFPPSVIEQLVRETKQVFYSRLLPPLLVLWGFIFQRVNPDHTCDAAWSYLTSETVADLRTKPIRGPISESTSSYCQARQRLPVGVAQQVLRHSATAIQQEVSETGLWFGRRVNLIDGSTVQLPATAALVEHYGVATNQRGGSHWPLMRIVAGFDLYTGIAQAVAEGPYRTREHPLAVQVFRDLGAGYVHVGDRYFGVYHIVQVIPALGSDALVRLTQRQAQALTRQALPPSLDLELPWGPSARDTCEPDLPTGPVTGRLIVWRLDRPGFRPIILYLFTTLTDRDAFPAAALVALYGERGHVELDLRHVKTTFEMNHLDGKSVDMVRKEPYLGLLAYNLLRGLMTLAAQRAGRLPLELSLAQCWRRVQEACRTVTAGTAPEDVERIVNRLLERLGRCLLPKRKRERFEPRAVWGRPQVYPLIKGSREQARRKALEQMQVIS
jgi:hypothetical protein